METQLDNVQSFIDQNLIAVLDKKALSQIIGGNGPTTQQDPPDPE